MSKTVKKRPQAKKTVVRKKKKKNSFKDLLPAVILSGALILVSVVISLVIIGLDRGNIVQTRPPLLHAPAETAQDKSALPLMSASAIPLPTTPGIPAASAKPATPEKTAAPPTIQPASTATGRPAASAKPTVPEKPVTSALPTALPPEAPAASPVKTASISPAAATQIPAAAMAGVAVKPKEKNTLVFIIDDAGNNLSELEPFLRFPGPLTIAVLPGLPHSAEAARRIRAAGKEVFLHQPMEAVGGQDPGPGAIYSWMNADEINETLKQNLKEISPVAGMNNHQGSKITADKEKMKTILAFCKSQGIGFLDSKTTADSAAISIAASLRMKIGERNIFIDNLQDRQSMLNYLNKGLELADQRGSAVMIGHAWSPELAKLLTENYKNFIDKGYVLTTASKFINGLR